MTIIRGGSGGSGGVGGLLAALGCGGFSCGTFLGIIVLNLLIGGWSVQYLCEVWLHKPISIGWATLMGLFLGEFTIPLAIVTWIAKKAGLIAMAMPGFLPV